MQGQFRVLTDALESRMGKRVTGEHPVVPWFVMHAASVISRGRKDHAGFTAFMRWKSREFNKLVAESGERVYDAPAFSAGRDTSDVR